MNALLGSELKDPLLEKMNLRQGSCVRIKNRCIITNRAKSVIRFFRLSRIQLRDHARNGMLLGVKRSSW